MRLAETLLFLLSLATAIHAFTLPAPFESTSDQLADLWKRRGGGGGRGGGSSGGSGRGGGKSGSSSGSSGSSGSRLTTPTSNTGGRTSGGSGPVPRAYASGSYYGGGASVPYKAGGASPRGISPVFLGVGALAFFPGIWLYGAYAYTYPGYYAYHNNTSNTNESRPMSCYCGRFEECGCDGNNETDYMNSIANNQSISRVADVDGQERLVVNGSLPNGTTASGKGASYRQGLVEMSGYWVAAATVVYAVWFI